MSIYMPKGGMALMLCLLILPLQLHAYASLSLPIEPEMSRSDVERILGRPGFLIYTGVMIQGIPEKMEVSMAGYRVNVKNSPVKLIAIIFFQDNVQLAVSAFYEKKPKDKLMAKILKNTQMKEIDIRGLQGYLDNKTLDFYLSEDGTDSPHFPPRDLHDYFQNEDFLNFAVSDGVIDAITELASAKHIPNLYSITYMNLRLVASVASQGLLTPGWKK